MTDNKRVYDKSFTSHKKITYDSDNSEDSSDLDSTPYNNPYMDKISLLEIKLYDKNIKACPPYQHFDEEFTIIPKSIFEILKKECENEIQKLVEYGKFNKCWYGAYGGVGHPDQYMDMYENKEKCIDFTSYIEFCGNEFEFYISNIDKKHTEKFSEKSEYMLIIEDIKRKLNDLWNNTLQDIAKSKNLKNN